MREKVAAMIMQDWIPGKDPYKLADQIHALYLAEGWQKVESRLVVEKDMQDGSGLVSEHPARMEEIVEVAEFQITEKAGIFKDHQFILKSGARVMLRDEK